LDEGVLVAGQDTIRIGDLPQHLDDTDAFFFAEFVDHNLSEVKQVRRLHGSFSGCLDKMSDLDRLQAEAFCQRALDNAFLAILDSVIATGNFDEQHGESESRIVLFGGSVSRIEPGQKAVQRVEHVPPMLARID
jgi:hypothetical protein